MTFFPGLRGDAAVAPGPVQAGGEPEAWPLGKKAECRDHSVRKDGHWLCSHTTSEDQLPAQQQTHRYVGTPQVNCQTGLPGIKPAHLPWDL